jgi:hypothetical protein
MTFSTFLKKFPTITYSLIGVGVAYNKGYKHGYEQGRLNPDDKTMSSSFLSGYKQGQRDPDPATQKLFLIMGFLKDH